MEGLQRSEVSFRRSGSSGLVWDDKLLSGELKKINTKEAEDHQNNKLAKSETSKQAAYKTVNVEPAAEPPSPRVSAGCCGVLGKKNKKKQAAAHGGGKAQKKKRKPAPRGPP